MRQKKTASTSCIASPSPLTTTSRPGNRLEIHATSAASKRAFRLTWFGLVTTYRRMRPSWVARWETTTECLVHPGEIEPGIEGVLESNAIDHDAAGQVLCKYA